MLSSVSGCIRCLDSSEDTIFHFTYSPIIWEGGGRASAHRGPASGLRSPDVLCIGQLIGRRHASAAGARTPRRALATCPGRRRRGSVVTTKSLVSLAEGTVLPASRWTTEAPHVGPRLLGAGFSRCRSVQTKIFALELHCRCSRSCAVEQEHQA